jgi:hypothetical protein
MALAGTLKDFSLADIFQLISLQKKTGYLTLRSSTDVVTVTFLEGNVVGAESLHKRLEDRLGHVLVKSGRISKEELTKALEVQKQTLQRLGYILTHENFIDTESLKAALGIQMQQTIYRLFRWKDGDYSFEPHDTVDYDREYISPMSAESILMEGIRMLDEWPLIEKKVPNFTMIFEKVPLPAPPILEDRAQVPTFDAGDFFGDAPAAPAPQKAPAAPESGPVRLSQEEMATYQHVNGVFTVQEIIDRAGLNEFETCKALFELLNRQLIRNVIPALDESEEPRRIFSPQETLNRLVFPVFFVWLGISVLFLLPLQPFYHPLNHIPFGNHPGMRTLRTLEARLQLERVRGAIQAFQLAKGRLPESLDELIVGGYIPIMAKRGPFGAEMLYTPAKEGNAYTLAVPGPERNNAPNGEILEDLVITQTVQGGS